MADIADSDSELGDLSDNLSLLDKWRKVARREQNRVKIDVELLINAVKQRPELWNKKLDVYSDRVVKKRAWDEVNATLNPKYTDLTTSNKQLFGKFVQSKWRNVKDSFIKVNKIEDQRNSCSRKKRRKYIHDEQLQFLKDVKGLSNSSSSVPDNKVSKSSSLGRLNHQKVGSPKTNTVDKATELIRQNQIVSNRTGSLDEHEAFFVSLLPTVRRFDEDQSLEFRASVISLIQQIKRRRGTVSSFNLPQSSSHFMAYYPSSTYDGAEALATVSTKCESLDDDDTEETSFEETAVESLLVPKSENPE